MTVETTTYIEYPGAFRVDAKTSAGTVVRIFKGGEFWMSDANVRREVSPAEADQMRGTVQRDVIGLLLALVDGKVGATRLPDVVNRDRRLTALGVGGAIKAVVLLLDPATSLIVAQRYDADRGDEQGRGAVFRLSKCQRPAGRVLCGRPDRRFAGGDASRAHVRYNVPLAADLFNWPG